MRTYVPHRRMHRKRLDTTTPHPFSPNYMNRSSSLNLQTLHTLLQPPQNPFPLYTNPFQIRQIQHHRRRMHLPWKQPVEIIKQSTITPKFMRNALHNQRIHVLLTIHHSFPPRQEIHPTLQIMCIFLIHDENDIKSLKPNEYNGHPQSDTALF